MAHNSHLIICGGELVDIWSQIQCYDMEQNYRKGCLSKRAGPHSRSFEKHTV